jgi:hypothetical protein
MADFNVRSDSVNVEQIMEQIRARIREKRGVDYTEQQIHELAAVKLEKLLDAGSVRSGLLEEFRLGPPEPSHEFNANTLFESQSLPVRWLRRLFKPLLTLFLNPVIQMLHVQSQLNKRHGEHDKLYYELVHNLVVEITRLGIEVKNLKMRVESLSSRVEFNERRARALESVVIYKPSAEDGSERPSDDHTSAGQAAGQIGMPAAPEGQSAQTGGGAFSASGGMGGPGGTGGPGGPGQRSRRRRRRRGRRAGAPAVAIMGQPGAEPGAALAPEAPETPPSDEPQASPPADPGNDSGQ